MWSHIYSSASTVNGAVSFSHSALYSSLWWIRVFRTWK